MRNDPPERYGLNSHQSHLFVDGSTLPTASQTGRPVYSVAGARASRALWREIVGLLHQDAHRESFTHLLARARALPPRTIDRDDLIHCIELALTVRERFELHQQRERGLLAVLESAQDLTAITDPDHILRAIVQRARKLLGCDVGYLSIHDPRQNAFYVRATDGAFSESFKRVRVPLGAGICSFVARHAVPYASSDYGADSRFPHNPGIDSAVTEENITSILGVPLLAGEAVTGVLFVGDRYVRAYTPWEKHILSVLAAHASVALNNAHLFEQTQTALRQASDVNQQLVLRTAETDRAAQAHERLTALAARGGTLLDICQMAAGILGGQVTAYDGGDQEIARAGTCQAAENIPPVDGDALHRALQDSRIAGRSVELTGDQASGACRVAAATGGLGTLGGLVIRTALPLREADVRTFERSAMLASAILLSRQQSESIAQTEMSALVRSLIGLPEGNPETAAPYATRLGLDLSAPLQLAVLTRLGGKAAYLAQDFTHAPAFGQAALDAGRDTLVLLANGGHMPDLLAALKTHIHKVLHRPATGALSAPIPSHDGLRAGYQRLQQCVRIMGLLHSPDRIFSEQELAPYTLLLAQGQGRADAIRFLHAALGPLYDPESPRERRLARTLLAYLDAGHNASAAAKALGIHLNTVHQRLDTLDGQVPDWRAPTRLLNIHMALRLWALDGGWTEQ